MKRLVLTLLLIVLPLGSLFSQGFEWEISPRMPFSIPKLYFGILGSYTRNSLNGSLTLYENYFSCAKFTSGGGNSNSFGLKIEYWKTHNLAFNASFNFQANKGSFVAAGDSFPIQIKGIPKIVKVENELAMDYKYLVADFGAKYRLGSTHLFIGGNLEFGLKLVTEYELFEKVKSPPEYHFIDNTQRRKIVDGRLSDLSIVVVNPKIALGYDATLFPGVYASPSIAVQIPLFNYSRQENLKLFSLQLSISILRGIR
ncbi:hypothetical protein D9V84_10840 [Bacteroidetes/Chlorobi group bacterium Naka2016]|jgi:hypothetical protein|nr:MAG: hypothetical protein D9V84_10840 [Bacteroidetes/Chlorobi group bacterium Naka2016]